LVSLTLSDSFSFSRFRRKTKNATKAPLREIKSHAHPLSPFISKTGTTAFNNYQSLNNYQWVIASLHTI